MPDREPRQGNPLTPAATLDWSDTGDPCSREFGDLYFNREDGLAESRYVFLEQNQLPQRWQALSPGSVFTIAELGFGTGLNFLAAWQLWRRVAPPDGRLHFVSFESRPLERSDLNKALARWPELGSLRERLEEAHPPPVAGVHRRVLDAGRVRLTLYLGDASQGLEELRFRANAWFLDGFAPRCNPGLWTGQVLAGVRRHSQPGTTLATFTAAGAVRRGLEAEGFRIEKRPGYGTKRDMLAGALPAVPGRSETAAGPRQATLVGAGLAGSLLARNLAERGWQVQVMEQSASPAAGASGNPQGAVYHRLGVDWRQPETQLALAALLFTPHELKRWQQALGSGDWEFWFPTGLLQLATSGAAQDRLRRFLQANSYPETVLRPVSAAEATRLSGIPCVSGGLFFPDLGWARPDILCQQLLEHPRIQCRTGQPIGSLEHREGKWWLDGTSQSGPVILCNATGLNPLLEGLGSGLPLKPIRGQISRLKSGSIRPPRTVVCADGYLLPELEGLCVTGASFQPGDDGDDLRQGDHEQNLAQLKDWLPGALSGTPKIAGGRAAVRATTPDYQPLVGAVPRTLDHPWEPPLLAPGSRRPVSLSQEYQLTDLYVFAGLGSKGLAMGPLLAEALADWLCDEPVCLPRQLLARIHPDRFNRPA